MTRFAPAEYYVVCLSFHSTPDVWRPLYADGRNVRLHTSLASAQALLEQATKTFHRDHLCIAKLTPEMLADQPAPTTTNTQGASS
jgi:hypothetical protein